MKKAPKAPKFCPKIRKPCIQSKCMFWNNGIKCLYIYNIINIANIGNRISELASYMRYSGK